MRQEAVGSWGRSVRGSGFGEGGSEREGFGGHVVSGRDGVTVMRVLVAVVVAGVVVLARR
jgi:hypothetical protein